MEAFLATGAFGLLVSLLHEWSAHAFNLTTAFVLGLRRSDWLALFFGIAVVGTAMSAPTSKQVDQQAQVVAALQNSEISWHKGGWNNIMMLNATVQNSGKRDVKDIVCDHLSKACDS